MDVDSRPQPNGKNPAPHWASGSHSNDLNSLRADELHGPDVADLQSLRGMLAREPRTLPCSPTVAHYANVSRTHVHFTFHARDCTRTARTPTSRAHTTYIHLFTPHTITTHAFFALNTHLTRTHIDTRSSRTCNKHFIHAFLVETLFAHPTHGELFCVNMPHTKYHSSEARNPA